MQVLNLSYTICVVSSVFSRTVLLIFLSLPFVARACVVPDSVSDVMVLGTGHSGTASGSGPECVVPGPVFDVVPGAEPDGIVFE